MRKFALPVLCLSMFAIAGCTTTPSPHQLAESGSWEQLGQLDGHRGLPERSNAELSELTQLQSNNSTLYQQGYSSGIAEFCSLDSGFFQGRSGFHYNDQCARFEHEGDFIESWEDGFVQYQNAEWDRNSYAAEYELATALQ